MENHIVQERLSFREFLEKLLYTSEFVQIQPEALPEGFRECTQNLNSISRMIRNLRLLSEESNDLLHQLANSIKRGIVILERGTGEIIFSNTAFETWMRSHPKRGAMLVSDFLQEYHEEEQTQWETELTYDGQRTFLEIDSFQVEWNDKKGIVHMLYDITAKRERHIRTEEYAYRDALTGLYNRRLCYDFLEGYIRNEQKFCVGFADLDNLKYVNDHFGHKEGDFYIKTAALVLKRTFRKNDEIFRIGGDEFVIVLKECTEQIAIQRMEKARVDLKKLYGDSKVYGGISYGMVSIDKNHEYTPEAILEAADRKMYHFKKIRQNNCNQE